jgi:tRNA1(Val) A37 N6-methylase TrmN6
MKKQRLPRGWTEKQIRDLATYHDSMTEEEQAAEIEAALTEEGQTLLLVPTELVPEILKLIRKKRTA